MTEKDPLLQDEALTLEAELRQALQHRRAAQQKVEQTRAELDVLMERARDILARRGETAVEWDDTAEHPAPDEPQNPSPPD